MTPAQADAVRRVAEQTDDPELRAELESMLAPPPEPAQAPPGGVYRYDINLMTDVREFTCRGKTFKVACFEGDGIYHPSVWSFMDEVETREAWWAIEPGDVVFDVGADFGSYTLSALAMGARQVHAWSPPFKLPDSALEAQTLVRSLITNSWPPLKRANVFDYGLWSASGFLASFDGPRPAQWFETEDEARAAIAGQPGHCSAFLVRTLDGYVDGVHQWPGERAWLKIDTEGAEEEILKGAVRMLEERKPTILLEYHELTMPGCEARLDAWLAEHGYEKVGRRPHHTIAHGLYKHREAR